MLWLWSKVLKIFMGNSFYFRTLYPLKLWIKCEGRQLLDMQELSRFRAMFPSWQDYSRNYFGKTKEECEKGKEVGLTAKGAGKCDPEDMPQDWTIQRAFCQQWNSSTRWLHFLSIRPFPLWGGLLRNISLNIFRALKKYFSPSSLVFDPSHLLPQWLIHLGITTVFHWGWQSNSDIRGRYEVSRPLALAWQFSGSPAFVGISCCRKERTAEFQALESVVTNFWAKSQDIRPDY